MSSSMAQGMTTYTVNTDTLRNNVIKTIENNEDINNVFIIQEHPFTLLSLMSCFDDCNDCVSALLAHGAKPEVGDSLGWALCHNAPKNTALLLEHIKDINKYPYEVDPLLVAIKNNFIRGFKFLVQKGIDLNRRDENQKVPLMHIIEQMQKAKRNKRFDVFAAWHSLATQLLKQRKIAVYAKEARGETAYDKAIKAKVGLADHIAMCFHNAPLKELCITHIYKNMAIHKEKLSQLPLELQNCFTGDKLT